MVNVQVRLFAIMAQQAGVQGGKLTVELSPGSRVEDVKGALEQRIAGLRWPAGTMVAVNQEYAEAGRVLAEGDEVAVIPPVSGG